MRYPHPRATSLPIEVLALPNRSACTFLLRCPAPPHWGALQIAPSRVWPDFSMYPKASPCTPVPLRILQVHSSDIPSACFACLCATVAFLVHSSR
ncbi:hypothetical protein Acr_00g0070730 [Actinidia rufa]|uniref:Uncharacterized protein n=1 Tax=Actinidia rufa TaxID=165716 RepID=A0A7J0DTF9_9ERIC|nr:hypothetical protein Acr_00g0070730 [Actinidia rufa]